MTKCRNDESWSLMSVPYATRTIVETATHELCKISTARTIQPSDLRELQDNTWAQARHSQIRLAAFYAARCGNEMLLHSFASVSLLHMFCVWTSNPLSELYWYPRELDSTTAVPPYMDSYSCFQLRRLFPITTTNAPLRITLRPQLVLAAPRRSCCSMDLPVAASAALPSSSTSTTKLSRLPRP
jgi:hypothetical protein